MSERIRPIVMPKWGLAMQEGMVAKWLVEPGVEITAGQEIVDIETSKIANVFESPVAGKLRRVVAEEGETLPVGALLAVVADDAVSDGEIDDYVTKFQEEFATHAAEAAEAVPEPETIEVAGRRIRYLELGEGEGPPVVFIHGFGGDLANWQYNQEVLAERHRTIALDLPGHGGSSKEVEAGDVAALAASVEGFLDAKGIERAHLVGHSLGGAIAIDVACNWPSKVASMTLICPAGLGPEINTDYIEGFLAAKRRKQMRPVLEMLVADPKMVSREMVEEVLKFRRIDGVDRALRTIVDGVFPGGRQTTVVKDRLGEIEAPVQIVWGKEDRIIPPTHADGVPGQVRVHVLEDAGHMVHLEKSADVNALIEQLVGS